MVVDDVEHHAEPEPWQASTNRLSPSGPPYGSCTAYQVDAVVAPAPAPLKALTGSKLDQVDAEVDQVVEAFDRGVERARRSVKVPMCSS